MADKIKVNYLSLREDTPKKDFWDYGLLYDLLEDFDSVECGSLENADFGIVVIPARSHFELVDEINKELSKLKGVVLFLMGDEEASFPVEKVKHDNIRIWVQNPHLNLDKRHRKLGTGYPFPLRDFLKVDWPTPDKSLDWFFAGQVTHPRREQCVAQLRNLDNGELVESKSFTAGIDQEDYFFQMIQAKIAPCPSGPITPDTFRLFEALELGCVPIADTRTSKEEWPNFWEWLFDEPVPFPTIDNWESLPGYIQDIKNEYPVINNRIQAWWLRKKNTYKKQIRKDIADLGGQLNPDAITVIIPVSPIPSHPDTKILEETINNVRFHLPYSEIILTFDGVREESEDKRADYEEHIRRILFKCREWKNVSPYIFEEHVHQSGMARFIIDKIETPLILYVEQDTPLVIDEPIDWAHLINKIMTGQSNVIRFHFEGIIPKEHYHLLIGDPEDYLLKTAQWSQRPHLASTPFYRRILTDHFSEDSKCFIEDLVHGRVQKDFDKDGLLGWQQWKLHIYYPDKKNIKRSYHTDGRAGTAKYDETQIW